jgi:hypothetical protein
LKTFNLKLEAWVVVLIAVAALLLTALVLAIIAELGTKARVAEEEKELVSLPYCHNVPDDWHGICHDFKDFNEETGLYPCNIVSDRISCFDVNTFRK